MNTEKYQTALETERDRLENDLKSIGVQSKKNESDWIATPDNNGESDTDSNIVADRAEDWEERRAIVEDLEIRLNNVKRALQKIADGTYGVCELSGEPIEVDRLDANPAARTNKEHINDEYQLPK